MIAAAFFDYRDGLFHGAKRFEVAQDQDGVGEISEIDRGLHRTYEALLREHQDGDDAPLIQKREQLVQLEIEVTLLGHGVDVTVETVDYDEADLTDKEDPLDS